MAIPLDTAIVLAALCGGCGAIGGGWMYQASSGWNPTRHQEIGNSTWWYSLGSWTVRVTAVLALVAAWYWGISSSIKARYVVPDATLKATYHNHRGDFERLASMLMEEENFHSIYSDGSYDRDAITRERADEYLTLLQRVGLAGCNLYSRREEGNYRIEIQPSGAFRQGVIKGFIYTTATPDSIVAKLDCDTVQDLLPGETKYVKVATNWYLFMQRPMYRD